MVAQSTNTVLYLLLMAAVTPLELSCRFPYVLTFTFLASSQVDYEGTITVQIFLDGVGFLSMCALEM